MGSFLSFFDEALSDGDVFLVLGFVGFSNSTGGLDGDFVCADVEFVNES